MTIRQVAGERGIHANISQTSTYLDSTVKGQHEAMRRFEEARARQVLQQGTLTDAVQAGATEGVTQGGEPLSTDERPN